MPSSYVPQAGDIVWLHFTPQTGQDKQGVVRHSCSRLKPITKKQV